MGKVLSQREIDALLSAAPEEVERKEPEVKFYDFKHPDRLSRDQVRVLRTVHEGFSRVLSTYLSTTARMMVDVELVSVDQVMYMEFTMGMSNPTCIYILKIEGLSGNALLEISPELVFFVIDRLFGGPGQVVVENRPVTLIEQTVLRKIVERMLEFLDSAWAQVHPMGFKIDDFETNPQFVQIAPASEPVVVFPFQVALRELKFPMNICFPYFVLEPVLKKFTPRSWMAISRQESDERAEEHIQDVLKVTEVEVVVELGEVYISLRDLLELEEGDVLILDKRVEEELKVKVNERLKFFGRPGVYRNRKAVLIAREASIEEQEEDDGSL
ncbi:MAG TPA: flagellar motor switch protein FliM [Candidatus Latescibacteria bacterium]|nr:flagellar motor switch protein FliM [Candidatus Latescibacterota bacterium]